MRKKFIHEFVNPIDLQQQNIDGTRYYALPDGEKFKSVTTILAEKTDKSYLIEWQKRVGEDEANKIRVQAARRGTAIHTIAEKYVLNDDSYFEGAMPSNVEMFMGIKEHIDKTIDNVLGVELPLFSRALRAAGKADLIARYNGAPAIIDFKTSRKLKKEEWITNYFLQATAYSLMFEVMYKIHIPQIVIIIGVDHEKDPQVFPMDRSKYVNDVIELFTN